MKQLCLAAGFFAGFSAQIAAATTFTFDTDAQGFTAGFTSTEGTLNHSATGGNTGGYIFAQDNIAGGGNLPVIVPGISGDLSGLTGISYDQLLPNGAAVSVGLRVIGTNGDLWAYRAPVSTGGVWTSVFADFVDNSDWLSAATNTGSFTDTVANVARIEFSLESVAALGREAGLDNVQIGDPSVVPTPATGLLLLTAGAAFAATRRRRS